MTESLEWMACFIAPQKRDHFFAPTESNPQLQPSKSKLFHQKLPLGLEKNTSSNQPTNQSIKNTAKKITSPVLSSPQKRNPGKFHRAFFFPIAFCQVWGLQWLGAQKAWSRRHQTPGHCGKLQGMGDTVAGRNAVNSPVDMAVYPSFHRVS